MGNFVAELRRRNVFKVILAYLIVGWFLIQMGEVLFPSFGAPDWVLKVFIVVVAMGFPLTILLAWALELTPEGIVTQSSLDGRDEEPVPVQQNTAERFSIAVLPFNNMSDNPQYELMADGMSEDLTTFLSRLPDVSVVARNSTFAYKGQSPDIRQVGRELGVRYVLEGSVRSLGSRIRVAAQLIETQTGIHLWANNFDAAVEDIVEIQDEMLAAIVSTVGRQLSRAESNRAHQQNAEQLDAWGWIMRAHWYGRTPSVAATMEMERCARKALEIDPSYAPAYGLLAEALTHESVNNFSDKARELRREAMAMLDKAEEIDSQNPLVMQSSGIVHVNLGDKATGCAKLKIVLEHNPNSATICGRLAYGLGTMGKYEEAELYFERCFRLASGDPTMWIYEFWRGVVLTHQPDKLEEAEQLIRSSITRMNGFPFSHITLGLILAVTNRLEEGQQEMQKARELVPKLTLEVVAEVLTRAARSPRMGEVFVQLLGQIWPDDKLSSA